MLISSCLKQHLLLLTANTLQLTQLSSPVLQPVFILRDLVSDEPAHRSTSAAKPEQQVKIWECYGIGERGSRQKFTFSRMPKILVTRPLKPDYLV